MATSRLSTRRVDWRVQVGTSNKAAQGLVIFEASVSYIPDPLATGGPRTAIPEPVAAVLDAGGYACTPDPTNPAKAGDRGVDLFTTDSLGEDGGDWTWTARPQLRSVNGIQMSDAVPAFSFHVPTGSGVWDLAKVQKVPASPGLSTEAAVALVARAEQAARDALNAVGDTVGAAAKAAVTAEIDSRDLLEAKATPEAVAFTITDASKRRSWLEIAPDGGLTEHAAGLVASRTVETIKSEGLLPIPSEVDTSAAVYGITDSSGRRSWMEIDKAGRPTPHAKSLIFEGYQLEPTPEELASDNTPEIVGTKLYVNNGYTAQRHLITSKGNPRNPCMTKDNHVIFETDNGLVHSAVPTQGVFPVVGSTALAFFGDSLTDSGPDDTYPQRVATRTGLAIYQGGVAGQASADIAIRQGGLQPRITVAGNSIPASGTVAVTALNPSTGYRQNGTGSFAFSGTLAGVPGNLVHNLVNDTWLFSRSTDGSAVPCPAGTRFIGSSAGSIANEDRTQIIWVGRNNFSSGATLEDARRDIASMVAFIKPYHKRYLIIGVTNGLSEVQGSARYNEIVEHNEILKDLYGPRYFDIRRPFIDKGLTMAGIAPTAADLEAIAKDAPPPSIMADELHPSDPAGATVVGDLVADVAISKGWHL